MTNVPEDTHCKVLEKDMAPLILDIEEDEEDADHHGGNDADHHHQTTVHPPACSLFPAPALCVSSPSSVTTGQPQYSADAGVCQIEDTITSDRDTATHGGYNY